MADQWQRERQFLLGLLKLGAALGVLVVGSYLSVSTLSGLARSVGVVVTMVATWELFFWAVQGTAFDAFADERKREPEATWPRLVRILLALVFAVSALLALRTEGLLQAGLAVVAAVAGGCAWWLVRRRRSRSRPEH